MVWLCYIILQLHFVFKTKIIREIFTCLFGVPFVCLLRKICQSELPLRGRWTMCVLASALIWSLETVTAVRTLPYLVHSSNIRCLRWIFLLRGDHGFIPFPGHDVISFFFLLLYMYLCVCDPVIFVTSHVRYICECNFHFAFLDNFYAICIHVLNQNVWWEWKMNNG